MFVLLLLIFLVNGCDQKTIDVEDKYFCDSDKDCSLCPCGGDDECVNEIWWWNNVGYKLECLCDSSQCKCSQSKCIFK